MNFANGLCKSRHLENHRPRFPGPNTHLCAATQDESATIEWL